MSEDHSEAAAEEIDVSAGYEKRDVNVQRIVIATVVTLALVIGSILWLDTYFIQVREQMFHEAAQYENEPLNKLREREAAQLTNYAVIDKEKGVYQIPIERAMEIIARENDNVK